jgi:hypothetical protein
LPRLLFFIEQFYTEVGSGAGYDDAKACGLRNPGLAEGI